MEGLNDLEIAVVSLLLAGDHPVLASLRLQFANARLCERELTGVGFYCYLQIPTEAPSLTDHRDIEVHDVVAQISGLQYGAGFVLFVRDGQIRTLEGFTYGEDWPDEIGGFELAYINKPRVLQFATVEM